MRTLESRRGYSTRFPRRPTGDVSIIAAGLIGALALAGCVGAIGPAPGRSQGSAGVSGPGNAGNGGSIVTGTGGGAATGVAGPLLRGPTGLARLSREELATTIVALLGVDAGADLDLLPADSLTPFDNDYTLQPASRPLIEALKAVAERSVARALADPALRKALVGCTPAGSADEKCLRDFIVRFGRRALRRPLEAAEVDAYAAFIAFAQSSNDFYSAVSMVVRAMLQDLEFIYRIEVGQPIADRPGTFGLTDWEIASRLSYFLWGANPDDQLLDDAAAQKLGTAAGRQAAAARLLADARGTGRIQRFHALWLGYERLPFAPSQAAPMRKETDALVKAVFDGRPWTDLFTATETYVNDELSKTYGLPSPGGADFAWVAYPSPDRRGILSHGSVLANGIKVLDSSPTLRGKFVRERLQCRPVPPPPPGVNVDLPPEPTASGSQCKSDRYAAHRVGTCAACHSFLDGVGFGLDNYDPAGRYRSTDDGLPSCPIEGTGSLGDGKTFHGPAELGAQLVASGEVAACAVRHLYQFSIGREIRDADAAAVGALAADFKSSLFDLRRLLLDWVGSDSFRERVIDDLGI